MDIKTGPEIGTTAAAVASCVSVLSAVTGQREEIMSYWLDLYYQVRCAHERAKAAIEAEAAATPEPARIAVEDFCTPAPLREKAARKDEPAPPKNTGRAGKPRPSSVGNTRGHDAAVYKREVRDRLLELRKNGVTSAQIAEAGRGAGFTGGDILSILEGRVLGVTVYRAIEAALKKLEGPAASGDTASGACTLPSPQAEGKKEDI